MTEHQHDCPESRGLSALAIMLTIRFPEVAKQLTDDLAGQTHLMVGESAALAALAMAERRERELHTSQRGQHGKEERGYRG